MDRELRDWLRSLATPARDKRSPDRLSDKGVQYLNELPPTALKAALREIESDEPELAG